MRTRAPSTISLTGVVVASAASHALALFVIPALPMTTRAPLAASEVEFVVEMEPPPPPEVPEVPEPPPTPVEPPPVERTPRDESRTTPPEVPTTVVEPEPPPVVAEVPRQPNGEPPRIDALSAARSAVTFEGPRMPRAADTAGPDVPDQRARDAELSASLTAALGQAANARPEGFGRRTLPEPVRRADGTLAYALPSGLTALVLPDGSFTFDDASGVSFGGMGNSEREGIQMGWGLEEWMMRRRGDDPHASLRRWFARETEGMRDELEDRYVERQARSAARGTRGRLARVLADEALAIEERRRRIFIAWDSCAEGEIVGDAVRAAVVDFVRERLAEGSGLAYGEPELDALNRGRDSTAEFRPYAD